MRLAVLFAFLPPAASATLACNCPDEGSPVVLSNETIARAPEIALSGAGRLECVERDSADRCSTYWIVPHAAGPITVTLIFSDHTTASDTIDYIADGHYPCRGDFRPIHDHITNF